jgi:hypothetical protein
LARRDNPDTRWQTVEPLETRMFLAAFASVGLDYTLEQGGSIAATVFSTEGDLAAGGATTGSQYKHGTSSRDFDAALPYNAVSRLADGRFVRNPSRGRFDDPDEANGAQFMADDGYGAGWWFGLFNGGTSGEIEYIVQRPTAASMADLAGGWRFSMLRVDFATGDFSNVTGSLNVNGTEVHWLSSLGSLPREFSFVDAMSADGRGTTGAGEYFYLSADGQTLVYADMADSDQIVSIAVATRADANVARTQIVGGYLLTWALAGPPARVELGNRDVAYLQRFLSLEDDGDYKIYDLDKYDDGDRTVIARGFWRQDGSTITLEAEDNPEDLITLTIGSGSKVLLGNTFSFNRDTDPVLGVATRVNASTPANQTILPVAAQTAGARGVVYELAGDRTWFVSDIQAKAGGAAIDPESVVAWLDAKDNRTYAAALTQATSTVPYGQVLLYRAGDNGAWTVRNLTTELGSISTSPIVRELNVMIGPDGIVHLVGLSSLGELLRYHQTGESVPGSSPTEYAWAYSNMERDELDPQDLDTPRFVGDLVPYATSWNGLNVAGLDANGKIWSVWWAPGLTHWTVSNLSQDTGAPRVAGGLTVYLTSWNGINIAGIDENGDLRVTWWVPSLGGAWNQSNLNELTPGSVKLASNSVSSYVSSWGGLNIAGIDTATGSTIVYWWVPREVDTGWTVSSITDAVPAGSTPLVRNLQGIAGTDGSLNLFGYAQNSDFLRYFWEPGDGGAWGVQDLTTIGVPK